MESASSPVPARDATDAWPPLPLDAWSDTATTLHRWLQIVGKIRLGHVPWVNHWWHATFYVTARGVTTSPMFEGTRSFEIGFDFVDHRLHVATSDGRRNELALEPQSVAVFHDRLLAMLAGLDLRVRIHEAPNELPDATPFPEDREHRAYDRDAVHRFWRILVQADRVMKTFRSRFIGKCSPVHLFWGALDMAVTRFSGRPAPEHPGGVPHLPDRVAREAYSHEVSSCGFWPGSGPVGYPAFYAYAYPEPEGFAGWRVRPDGAFYSAELREFILPYDAVRVAADPDATLLEFFQSTYEAAATLGTWDRGALERA
jgi:hypothetical protein